MIMLIKKLNNLKHVEVNYMQCDDAGENRFLTNKVYFQI
jgi:hypothetical protein